MFAFRRVFNLTSQFRPILRTEANSSHNSTSHQARLPAFLQPHWLLRAYLNAYPTTAAAFATTTTSLAVSTAAAATAATVATLTTSATANNAAASTTTTATTTTTTTPTTSTPLPPTSPSHVNYSSVYRPKAGTGDDAHFTYQTSTGDVWLAVLDGVGGWGSAASIFSNKLAQEAVKLLQHDFNTQGKHGPKELLKTAHSKVSYYTPCGFSFGSQLVATFNTDMLSKSTSHLQL
jgi:hypothetical protein